MAVDEQLGCELCRDDGVQPFTLPGKHTKLAIENGHRNS